jgi:hypothetical protein
VLGGVYGPIVRTPIYAGRAPGVSR